MSKNLENIGLAEIYAEIVDLKKQSKVWLTPEDVNDLFGISKSSQAKMRMASNSSTMPFHKVGARIFYQNMDLNAWIEDHKVQRGVK